MCVRHMTNVQSVYGNVVKSRQREFYQQINLRRNGYHVTVGPMPVERRSRHHIPSRSCGKVERLDTIVHDFPQSGHGLSEKPTLWTLWLPLLGILSIWTAHTLYRTKATQTDIKRFNVETFHCTRAHGHGQSFLFADKHVYLISSQAWNVWCNTQFHSFDSTCTLTTLAHIVFLSVFTVCGSYLNHKQQNIWIWICISLIHSITTHF